MSETKVVALETKTEDVSQAVWNYMTSLKTVKKRDGREEAFQKDKLHRSMEQALLVCGITQKKTVDDLAGWVISRLERTYDGHTTPTTEDIREMVLLTFVDRNLVHVAKKYAGARQQIMAQASSEDRYGKGITFERFFTKEGVHPYDMIQWVKRDASITDSKGKVVFEQKEVEAPDFWSQTAINIVVSKYFRGKVGSSEREVSAKQLISRVADTMADWGRKRGYFQSSQDAQIFQEELTAILINQMAAFNSPVWFNVGINPHPQCSACFINSVDDDMRSILTLAMTEGMLFKGGSGTGSNLSKLRSSQEYLGGSNGRSSGPVSFMKGLDAFAGVIKSGGKTRRAAKMVILNVDHPDIVDFIECKVKEEKKAWALVDAGYDASIDGDAYSSIFFQNANNSVRVTDEFMRACEVDGEWITHEVTTGKPSLTYKAKELLRKMSTAAWECGDPGVQYDTTVNTWHTCKTTGRINASNPCSEYMFLDDTACNLSSLNLMKFRKRDEQGMMIFDVEAFKKANEVMITAMEIAVGASSYPTPAIEQNSHDFRPLGIGYANLGALLMSRGLAYDSDEGRRLAAAITSLQSGHCYYQSAKIAEKIGPFAGYKTNEESCLQVMKMHRDASVTMQEAGVPEDLLHAGREAWDHVVDHATKHGLRNSQISVIAPTGTISFLMDCDTTGVEPDIALVKYKWLVGGGMVKIVNQTVPEALVRLGYSQKEVDDILAYIDTRDTIEGAPHFKEEHLPVFDCAFKPANGERSIHYMGHLRMMAAVQPFISGAISKTVNMPHNATVEEVERVYVEGWKLGLKAIAIYRDGCKRQQALTTSKESDQGQANREKTTATVSARTEEFTPRRRRLPDERRAVTHKFSVGGHEGYLTVGLYDDGTPGEMFVTMSKEGSTLSGLINSFATSVSVGLQYGVPLSILAKKFVHVRFEPSGFTTHPEIRIAKSIVDYIFRWLALRFLSETEARALGVNLAEKVTEIPSLQIEMSAVENVEAPTNTQESTKQSTLAFGKGEVKGHTATFSNSEDAPACGTCGSIMVRNAACYKCLNCGSTSGCS